LPFRNLRLLTSLQGADVPTKPHELLFFSFKLRKMTSIGFYCDPNRIEHNALTQLQQYAEKPHITRLCAFTDIHYCTEKALPVGVAFETTDYCYPLVTGKDIGCGVMYLRIGKEDWLKPFDKNEHYKALVAAHHKMTDDGLGGGNHFLSLEEDASSVYIICHTGTRDRGIALYQQCIEMTRSFSQHYDQRVDFVHRQWIGESFWQTYQDLLRFGHQRRKAFCIKTLLFLQQARYIATKGSRVETGYLKRHYNDADLHGSFNGVEYMIEDSVHNHIRMEADRILHRKGSTELASGKTAVIPLSMSRGSLLVKPRSGSLLQEALFSCAHGAGRRLSRFGAMKYWKTVLKERERKAYRQRFSEMLDRSGEFPSGYVQEFDFAYKASDDILRYQPYLEKVTETTPIVTVKFTDI